MAHGKRAFISLSSSSDSDEIEQDDDDDSYCDDDDDSHCDDDSETPQSSDGDDDGRHIDDGGGDGEESISNKVIGLIIGAGDNGVLSLQECKSYLREHGLRVSGTKADCMQRILEHSRIKDGNAEALYPRSSFCINCTGDVCKGDTVLFTQKVFKKFDKVTRHGECEGKRTVAGRVVKESYGAAKQQHTFTVEVLWSKGVQRLPPLFPLLVKGRNLYKMRTFRQRWDNEALRKEVLDEKHKRGAAARHVRDMRKTRTIQNRNGGAKRQKDSCHERPSKMRKTTERDKGKHGNVHAKATSQRHEKLITQGTPLRRSVNQKQTALFKYSPKHQKFGPVTKSRGLTNQWFQSPRKLNRSESPRNIYHSQNNYHHHQPFAPSHFLDTGMSSTARLAPFPPLMYSSGYQGPPNHGNHASQGNFRNYY